MPDFIHDPPLPSKTSQDGFVQTIRFMDGDRQIGLARWYASANIADGTVQILELSIAPNHARKGHGNQLLDDLIAQCQSYFRARKSTFRRLWMMVEQKRQVIGRSFLTGHGFHHVGSMKDLLVDQDGLIYMRGMD